MDIFTSQLKILSRNKRLKSQKLRPVATNSTDVVFAITDIANRWLIAIILWAAISFDFDINIIINSIIFIP